MTASPLKKYVLTPLMLSAAVFSALTLPLAVLGEEPIAIEVQEESIFQGKLRDAAMPYLGLATAISLGAGIATVAVTGWRNSAQKSQKTEAQLSELSQSLKEKAELLESIKLSESWLEASGLKTFLEEELKLEPGNLVESEIQEKSTTETPVSEPIKLPVVQPLIITNHPIQTRPISLRQMTVQSAAAKFASAQTVLGYNRAKPAIKESKQVISPTLLQVEELQNQIETLMTQIQALQISGQPNQYQVLEPINSTSLTVLKSSSIHSVAS